MSLLEKILNYFDLSHVKNIGLTNYTASFDDLKKSQTQITDFLLKKCDVISWTNYTEGIFSKNNWEKDADFAKKMNERKSYFIKKTQDNIEYGEIKHKNKIFSHYFFRIEGEIRQSIKNEGPILTSPGFWDPVYYNNEKLIAAVIAHEPIIAFSLSNKEAMELKEKGVVLQKIG